MTSPPRTPRRILIGAASFADAQTALRLVERLSRVAETVVGGVLVEDTSVHDLPRLTRQRIVTIGGSLVAVPTREEARDLFERDARAFEAALLRLAGAAKTIERRRGDLAETLWDAARGWDMLILGQREIHSLPGQVVLIAPDTRQPSPAAAMAEDLAQTLGTSVLLLPAPTPERDASHAALLSQLARINCAAILIDGRAEPLNSVETLRRITEAARCPVVVLGPSPEHSQPES